MKKLLNFAALAALLLPVSCKDQDVQVKTVLPAPKMAEHAKKLILGQNDKSDIQFIELTESGQYLIKFQKPEGDGDTIEIRSYAGEEEDVVIENDFLKLTMDATTTQFSVLVKETGKVWYSNAQNTDTDGIALTSEKDRLNSTIAITYSDASGVDTAINSYGHSAKNGLYEIYKDEE